MKPGIISSSIPLNLPPWLPPQLKLFPTSQFYLQALRQSIQQPVDTELSEVKELMREGERGQNGKCKELKREKDEEEM